ncbi:histidinol-phosphate transaminase [Brackiella oedipodis]|uniref:histidinol-phosphate transaminase n=1 Tax=Brackiella oedipodis TaxID=124225 RepID=UPI000491C165|nr:histidinol-phosphate transaminase [Brackiella oedipodis]
MTSFWSDSVHQLEPYVPGEQPKQADFIKLNSNESPFAPSPKVRQALQQALDTDLQKYPDPESEALRATIAQYYQLQADQVFVGNGSDEVLAHSFRALLQHPGRHILFPDITYSFYKVYAALYEVDYQTIPLGPDFSLELSPYLQANPQAVSAVIIANPNAPTGKALRLQQIEQLLQAQPNLLVIVDEAYVDFGAQSAASLVPRYDNLLVVQTLSKSRSLAGLRVGVALGQADLLQALVRVKNSFNSYPLDRLAQVAAQAAFEDETYFQQCRQQIISSRQYLSQALMELGFEVLPSQTNFVFVRHAEIEAAQIAAALRQRGILVRHFKQARIENFLRITIGLQVECQQLIQALQQILSEIDKTAN